MLPGLKIKLVTAVKNRIVILIIAKAGESTRQIEPWLVWESRSEGLMMIGRQTHGHSQTQEELPAWRKLMLGEVTQLELTNDRFELTGSETYVRARKRLQRKPLAEVRLNTEYTELTTEEHAPPPPMYSTGEKQ